MGFFVPQIRGDFKVRGRMAVETKRWSCNYTPGATRARVGWSALLGDLGV